MTPTTNDANAMVEPNRSSGDRRDSRVSRRGRFLLGAIVVILLMSLAGITLLLVKYIAPSSGVAKPSETQGIEWVRSIYGWGKAPSQQLQSPSFLYVDSSGNIWTSDVSMKQVIVFSPEGKFLKTMGNSLTNVTQMGAITVGPEGAVYITEPGADRVRVVSRDDKDLGVIPIPDPTSIAYRDGMLVIGSRAGFAVVDANTGKPIKLVGQFGHGPGQFDTVRGICIGPDKTIYVIDTYNNRLGAYRPDGKMLWTVRTGAPQNKVNVTGAGAVAKSTESTAPAKLQIPSGLTMDGAGHLVVADPFNFSLSLFDAKDGKFLAKYGADGAKDGQFQFPANVAYDPAHDWFAVADTGNHRVQLVRLPGSSGSLNPVATVRRSLTGPLRICLAPLALLVVLFVLFVVNQLRRRRSHSMPEAS
ncbi:MAG: NHL repeat-containing protein [Bacteroidota bacterium]